MVKQRLLIGVCVGLNLATIGTAHAQQPQTDGGAQTYMLFLGGPIGNSPQEFAAHIRAEQAKWSKVIREAHVRIE